MFGPFRPWIRLRLAGTDMKNFQSIYTIIVVCLVLEFISPVPLFLSFGSLYILVKKPAWFLNFVKALYNEQGKQRS